MEDDLTYFLKKEDDFNFLKMEDDLKKIMQQKTIKSKNNDCGTAPGNLVIGTKCTQHQSKDDYQNWRVLVPGLDYGWGTPVPDILSRRPRSGAILCGD